MMIQTSIAPPAQARHRAEPSDSDPLDPLIRLAGDLRHIHALIVGERSPDLMCRLIRSGCLAATTLRVGDKPDADDYQLVLVPRAAALSSLDDLIKLARHALAPRGKLIGGVADATTAVALARRLRLNGFAGLRSVHSAGLMLMRADLRRVS